METIDAVVLGLRFPVSKSVIEQRILDMDEGEFVSYAKQFIPYPHHSCSYYADPSWFKSREEWERYEVEGDGHKLIRRVGGVKLYWRGTLLECLVEYSRPPSG